MRTAQDFVDYINQQMGERASDIFTQANLYGENNRTSYVTVKETQSSKAPDVTINADYININIKIAGNFSKRGEDKVLDRAMKVYRMLRLKTDLSINGHRYHYVQALTPPVHTGYDEERGISTYEFNCEILRELGGY